jgi:hypothetical protein
MELEYKGLKLWRYWVSFGMGRGRGGLGRVFIYLGMVNRVIRV